MKQFLNDVIINDIGANKWELEADFGYENDKYKITVGSGFITDGASIPRLLWSAIGNPMENDLLKPAIVHDGLYTLMQLERKECDKLLKEMLLFNGVSRLRSELIYIAVRLFGGAHWRIDTTEQKHLITVEAK
jgi:hypothetical protein